MYTRALAREWAAPGTTSRCSLRIRTRSSTTSAARKVVRPDIGGLLPVFVLDRYEGFGARLPELSRGGARALRRGECGGPPGASSGGFVFANHVLLGGPAAAASGARYAVKAHGSELSTRCGNAELSEWEGVPCGRRGRLRRPNTSATCSKTSSRRPGARRVAGCRRGGLRSSPTRRGVAAAARREPRRSPEPRQRQRASTRREERRAVRVLLRHRGAYGSLLREAPPATRESTSCSRRFARSTRGP